jgi:hypothetical protein
MLRRIAVALAASAIVAVASMPTDATGAGRGGFGGGGGFHGGGGIGGFHGGGVGFRGGGTGGFHAGGISHFRGNPGFSNRGFAGGGFVNRGFANRGFAGPGFVNRGFVNRGFVNRGFANRGFAGGGFVNRGFVNRGFVNRGFVGRRFVHSNFGRRFAFFGPGIGFGLGLGLGWPYYSDWPYYDYASYGDGCWVWTPDGYINVCCDGDYCYWCELATFGNVMVAGVPMTLPKRSEVIFADFFLQTYPVCIKTKYWEKLLQFHWTVIVILESSAPAPGHSYSGLSLWRQTSRPSYSKFIVDLYVSMLCRYRFKRGPEREWQAQQWTVAIKFVRYLVWADDLNLGWSASTT